MQYLLRGYDEDGRIVAEQEIDAVDDDDMMERAEQEIANGGYEHCIEMRVYQLRLVSTF